MTMQFAIRPYQPADLYRLYEICLRTGKDGEDASGTVDPEILGHFFAAPYAVLEPDLCFILTGDGVPLGYILGTRDSAQFAKRSDCEWFPALRERYARPASSDQPRQNAMIQAIHKGYQPPDGLEAYPAHLHIDILPEGQGSGWGQALMTRFISTLEAQQVPGLHLGVSKRNERALRWYPKLGFQTVQENAHGIVYGMKLPR